MPSIHLFTTMCPYKHLYNNHFLKKNIYHFSSSQTKHKIITSFIIMYKHIDIKQGGWKSPKGVP